MSNRFVFLVYLPSDQILTFFSLSFLFNKTFECIFGLFLDEMYICFLDEPANLRTFTRLSKILQDENALRRGVQITRVIVVFQRGPTPSKKVMNEWTILLPTSTQSENDGVQIEKKKQEKNNYYTQKYITPIANNAKKNTDPELAHLFTTQARLHVINAKNRVGNQIICIRKLNLRSTGSWKRNLGNLKTVF